MNVITRRAFSRANYSAPIAFTRCEKSFENFDRDHYCTGEMKNSSLGGLCFETDTFIPPGTTIKIKMPHMSDPYWFNAKTSYIGEVRWCREKSSDSCYGIGIKFINEFCAKCGKIIKQASSDHPDLCNECYGRKKSLPECMIDASNWNYMYEKRL